MKLITIVTPCFNEEENVKALHGRIAEQMRKFPCYDYKHLFIDNASSDKTVQLIKELCELDSHVCLIVNTRNFGHIRSPYYGLMNAPGDAAILMASDLQDPPDMIPHFIEKWEAGFKVVAAVKPSSRETPLMFLIRRIYYMTVGKISEIELIPNFTGFGLYDHEVIKTLRSINDPYPYFRGLIAELGYPYASIPFEQPKRVRGITKNNFYTLYDMAMLGIVSHSKIPLRLATLLGFTMGGLSLLFAVIYLVYKLAYWEEFKIGIGPAVIGLFFFTSIQLFFLGILGEYVLVIHTQTLNRPLVVEKERINV